jgi:hypothetical protein
MPSHREPRERLAKRRATEILDENRISESPVIPEHIAALFPIPLPIESVDGFPPDTYGALYKSGNDFRILISTSCPTEGHRRFTLCHELGHFFLDDHLGALFDGGASAHFSSTSHFRGQRKDWYELEADAFASELLVPTSLAQPLTARHRSGLHVIETLADTFQCSVSCAAIRFAALTDEPAAVIISKDGTVEWAAYSGPLQEFNWTRRRVRGDWAPRGSATRALALDHDAVRSCERRETTGYLSEWFDGSPHVETTEEALGLGSYGRVLTVLTPDRMPSAAAVKAKEDRMARGPDDWRGAMRDWGWDSYEDEDQD